MACGDLDGDGMDEIVTGAGPGAVFGPHVRGWNYDGSSLSPITGISFFAFDLFSQFGVNVGTMDTDGDGRDEILTGAGQGETYGPEIRIFGFEGDTTEQLHAFEAYTGEAVTHGVKVTGGTL